MKTIIAIYPGRFQPFGKHHAEAFRWLQNKFGAKNTFIATSDKVEPPKSPFSFQDKKQIIKHYGLSNNIVQTKNPYKAEEILGNYDPSTTSVVFMVGSKDMQEDPRFKIGLKKNGEPSYFQEYEKNKNSLQGFDKHGYLIIAPHISIDVPGYGEMSGTSMRNALGDKSIPRSEKIELFKGIFGWYDESTANMIFDRIESVTESVLFSKNWWADQLFLDEGYMSPEQQKNHDAKIEKLRNHLRQMIGREFVYDFNEFPKTVYGVKIQESKLLKEGGSAGHINCEICKKEFRQITENHLKYKHGITLKEYIDRYPDAVLISESLRKELRDNNPMKDKKNIDKIFETKFDRYGNKNYNNILKTKKTKLDRYGSETYNNPKFGDDNASRRPDVRERIRQKVTESYIINPELKSNRSDIGKKFGFGNTHEFKKKMISVGKWKPDILKSDFDIYRNAVRDITETNYQIYFKEIPNAHLRSKQMHLDHKYSIYDGFEHDIDPHIIGHYKNLEIIDHSLNESKGTKSSISLKKLAEEILTSKNTLGIGYQLLVCGGSAGHMAHPFDIPSVKTGKDLLKVFVDSVNYLKKQAAAVKIDGVNASIRLVDLDGKKQFVLDRGSMKPLDVKGITKDDLFDRFGEGHGMIKIGGKVLDIFNESLNSIQPELKSLGLWDNPNIMFNLEYVEGSTNVLQYNKNFLAIHGLLELFQATPKRRETKEISYNDSTMSKLLNKLKPFANKNGYEILGSIPTELTGNPDFIKVLNEKYTIDFGTSKQTKTLNQWLSSAEIPKNTVKTVDGKLISALSKEVLIKLSENTPLPDFIKDPNDYQSVIDGYFIYLATMKLGDAVLEKLNSPLGPVTDHEGIVIRDPKIFDKPFKITGKFILGGLASTFRK